MYLKLAQREDFGAIKEMSLNFKAASPLADWAVDEGKLDETINSFLNSNQRDMIIILLVDEKRPVGLLAALSQEVLFSREKHAIELIWWVEPKYRRNPKSTMLVRAFLEWSRRVGCRRAEISHAEDMYGPRVEKFYKSLGFKKTSHHYVKEVN
jgi:GNAT superfamily N-acetyltransferase